MLRWALVALLTGATAAAALAGYHLSYRGEVEQVTIRSGDIELAGTLVLPADRAGPVPGVVLLHGSGPETRGTLDYRVHSNELVRRGFAVLSYDKRGAGQSGGDFGAATYADFINDAIAAITALRQHPAVAAERVGLVGTSESGWFTHEVAERSGGIRFIVNKAGPVLSWRDTVEWEVYNDLLSAGVDAAEAAANAALHKRIWSYYAAPTESERAALTQALQAWRRNHTSDMWEELPPPTEQRASRYGYDPSPFLERGDVPSLYLHGDQDVNIPTAKYVERLDALRERGRPFSYHVFKGAGHSLMSLAALPLNAGFVDGYFEIMGDFATSHAGADTGPAR